MAETSTPGSARSPNYPALSLAQAVAAAGKLHKAEKRTPVSHETAAQALGFKSLSGPARVTIAALRQYGLIDKLGKGTVRVSDVAVRALHGNPDDQRAAMREAATNPPLFKELARDHSDASENAIASYLVTKRDFNPDGARKAARAFRATISLASQDASGYTSSDDAEGPEDMIGNDAGQDGAQKGVPGVFSMTIPFAKGAIAVQVRVTGDSLKPAHLARVRKYLELAEADWNADAEDA